MAGCSGPCQHSIGVVSIRSASALCWRLAGCRRRGGPKQHIATTGSMPHVLASWNHPWWFVQNHLSGSPLLLQEVQLTDCLLAHIAQPQVVAPTCTSDWKCTYTFACSKFGNACRNSLSAYEKVSSTCAGAAQQRATPVSNTCHQYSSTSRCQGAWCPVRVCMPEDAFFVRRFAGGMPQSRV